MRIGGREQLWILNGKVPEPCADSVRWALAFEASHRDGSFRVGLTAFEEVGIEVSTVFLGTDQGWGSGAPILFETRVFGPEITEPSVINGRPFTYHPESSFGTVRRYSTWEQAEQGHAMIVEMVKKELAQKETSAEVIAGAVMAKLRGEV